METVGIRELKTNLSRHLKRVRSGARLLVTERGRSIATIAPVDVPDAGWVTDLIADGRAQWSGGKPAGASDPVTLSGRRSASSVVIEDRR
jgi:prevent-host-death family protein